MVIRHGVSQIKTLLIERRGEKCEQCGFAGPVILHHIKPVSDGGSEYQQDNMVLLCKPCHDKEHGKVSKTPEIFMNPNQTQYNQRLIQEAEERRQRIQELYDVQKLTMEEIGEREGLTRQRVHQILRKTQYHPRPTGSPPQPCPCPEADNV
jgi:hypothetical protein